MKYKTIKWVLKKQIESGVKTLWTWEKGSEENFTCVYKCYGNNLRLYTPQQLLNLINGKTNI
tara:strand:+ start:1213 stop:1398 length:186 start_codon:yes stop_codon:yes gene_type:complete